MGKEVAQRPIGPLRDMLPMMRGRGPYPGTRPSAYQFHPNFLLYSGNMVNIAHYRIISGYHSHDALTCARGVPKHHGQQGPGRKRSPRPR